MRSPRDLGSAILFLVFGIAALYFGRDLAFGTSGRMGPGYFPTILSIGVIVLALIVGLRSLAVEGPELRRIKLRPLITIIISILAFGVLVDAVGLAAMAFIVIIMSGFAQRGGSLRDSILLAVGLSAFVIAIFVYALGQPLPIFWWQG